MPATIATAFTADQMLTLGHQVNSSAMISWALVQGEDSAELLVLFRQDGTVYRYAFRSWEDASNWDDLRQQDADADAEPISWGRALHRYLKNGALLTIAA